MSAVPDFLPHGECPQKQQLRFWLQIYKLYFEIPNFIKLFFQYFRSIAK